MKHLQRRQKYNQAFKSLNTLAFQKGLPVDVIGQIIIEEKRPDIERYLLKNGVPFQENENPVTLAVKAELAHNNNIAKKIKETGNDDLLLAENSVFADDQNAFDDAAHYDGEYNDFAPALLAVIGSVASKAIGGINEKRKSQGKKPILGGKFWNFLRKKTENVQVNAEGDDLNVRIAAGQQQPQREPGQIAAGIAAARAELERQAKKDYLKKNLPFIIIGVVLLIAIVYMIAKKK